MRRAARRLARLSLQPLEDRDVPSGTDVIAPPDQPIVEDVKVEPPVDSGPGPYVPTQEDIDRGYMLFKDPDVLLETDPNFIYYSMADAAGPQNAPQPSLAQFGGRLWKDRNGNGLQDAGEPGLPYVTLGLVQPSAGRVGTTQTDAIGNYAFNVGNVTNGTADANDDGLKTGVFYQIFVSKEQLPLAGLRPTTINVGTDDLRDSDAIVTTGGCVLEFTMGPELHYSHYDFGYVSAATIGNLVWSDTNNNGIKDPSEHGMSGVVVRLLDLAKQVEVAWTMTGADGSYLFTALAPGTYTVEIEKGNFSVGAPLFGCASSTGSPGQPTGHFEGAWTPDASSLDSRDHGWTSVDGSVRCTSITVSPGHLENKSIDFGFFRPGTLSGRVYVDINANGRSDYEDSTGLAGIKVTAAGPAGMFTAMTDATGRYSFANLPAATYTITITKPTGYRTSTPTLLTAAIGPTAPTTIDFGAVRAVDLSVKLTARPNAVGVGGIITLTYRVKNLGTLDATGVMLMMPLPTGMKIVDVNQYYATFDQANQRASIATLAAGADAMVVLRVRAMRAGTFHLMSTVQSTASEDMVANNRSMVWAVVGMPWSPPVPMAAKPMAFLTSSFRR